MEDPAAVAREIIDTNQYMVLATADAAGRPWITPVWFAHDRYREFLWLSRPGRKHSQLISDRREIAITIFDSTQRIGTGYGVTMSAVAEVLEGPELAPATEIVTRRSAERGGGMFTIEMVEAGASLRLYRAVATEQFVIMGSDERVRIEL